MPFKDLREFIAYLADQKELKINQPVASSNVIDFNLLKEALAEPR